MTNYNYDECKKRYSIKRVARETEKVFEQLIDRKWESNNKCGENYVYKEPIKVLLYSERWTNGGIEAFIMNIYRNIDRNIISADILTSQDETDIYDEEILKLNGKKYVILDKKYSYPIVRTLKNLNKFKKELKSKNYDIIHLNICHGVGMIYAYLAKKSGIKNVILHSHTTNIGNRHRIFKKIGHVFCKYLFERYADEYLACSDLAAKWLYTKKTFKSGKVKIIRNAIDTNKFIFNKQEREKFRKELNIEDKFVVGHIGWFRNQKNHEYLIDVFKEINNIKKDSVLLLIGDGELKQDIKNKVNKLGIKDNVIFYGTTKNIPRVLWGMDVFVFPSTFEGLGIVAIEAQAAGLITICSENIPNEVNVTDLFRRLEIQSGKEKWAEEIIKFGKEYKRKNMYKVLLENNYDIKNVVKDIEEIYIKMFRKTI